MRNLIIGVAAAIAVMAVPSIASADTRALLGVHYTNADSNLFADDVSAWGLNGAFNYDFSNGWTVQADGQSDRADVGGGNDIGLSYSSVSMGMRNDQYALYGSVGMGDFLGLSQFNLGIGGQLYLSNITLGASFSYGDIDGADSNPTNVSVEGTWFFNDNLGLTGRISHTDRDNLFGPNDDYNTYSIGGEYRFDNSPVSISLAYGQSDTDPDEVNAWRVGLTMDFGSDSLRDRLSSTLGS